MQYRRSVSETTEQLTSFEVSRGGAITCDHRESIASKLDISVRKFETETIRKL